MSPVSPVLLAVRHLKVQLRVRSLLRTRVLHVLDGIHFDLRAGEALAVIDENRVGAEALAQVLTGESAIAGGSVSFSGQELAGRSRKQLQAMALPIQRVQATPPRTSRKKVKVADCLTDSLRLMQDAVARSAGGDVAHWLAQAGLPADLAQQPVRELDAAQCWRLGLARALAAQPRLLICDLDELQRADADACATLEVLARLRREAGITLLLLAREPGLARALAARVLVMYYGRVMEQGSVSDVFGDPRHPYTRALLTEHGWTDADGAMRAEKLREGAPPDLSQAIIGCRFASRCPMADALCMREAPQMRTLRQGSGVACHYIAESWQPPRRAA